MNADRIKSQSPQIGSEKLLALLRLMIHGAAGRDDDEYPLSQGPWDSVIREALEPITVFGPHPEPWRASRPWRFPTESIYGPLPEPWKRIFATIAVRHPATWDVIGGGLNFGDEVALNPQPLPPRYAFMASLANKVTGRAELLQEIEDAVRRADEQRGIIIVSGYIARFIDDICGNGFRFKWPFPWPRPNWFTEQVEGPDLAVLAIQFEQAAKGAFSQNMRQHLMDASAKLVEAGMAKMH